MEHEVFADRIKGFFPCPKRSGDLRIVPEDLHLILDHDKAVEVAGSAVRHEGDILWCLPAGGMHRVAGFLGWDRLVIQ